MVIPNSTSFFKSFFIDFTFFLVPFCLSFRKRCIHSLLRCSSKYCAICFFTFICAFCNDFKSYNTGYLRNSENLFTFFRTLSCKTFRHLFRRINALTGLWSISPTFYRQLLCRYSFPKKLQSQTISRKNLHKTLSYQKATSKMLVKLKPGVNSINLLAHNENCLGSAPAVSVILHSVSPTKLCPT